MNAGLPILPPPELAWRTGYSDPDDPLRGWDDVGRGYRAAIEALLAQQKEWTWESKRALDFGCGAGRVLRHFLPIADRNELHGCDIDAPSIEWLGANFSPPLQVFVNEETPPLARPSDYFDVVWATSVFSHLTTYWAEWLLELRRVLKPGGFLIASFLGEGMSSTVAGETWNENVIGMNVLQQSLGWDRGGPIALLSPWWIREHWGRAFDIVELQPIVTSRQDAGIGYPRQGHGLVLARKVVNDVTPERLRELNLEDRRGIAALQHNIGQLHLESQRYREAYFDALDVIADLRRANGATRYRIADALNDGLRRIPHLQRMLAHIAQRARPAGARER